MDAADSDFLADEVISCSLSNETMDDSDLSAKFVFQKELVKNTENWFNYIAEEKEDQLIDICLNQAPDKLKNE